MKRGTYRISSPTAMTEATKSDMLPEESKSPQMEGEIFFTLPALSNLPSVSKYAGLNFCSQPDSSLIYSNEFGTVSCMLPIEVYL